MPAMRPSVRVVAIAPDGAERVLATQGRGAWPVCGANL